MSKSPEATGTRTEDPAEARDRIVEQTAEWLTRATVVLHTIGNNFPYTDLERYSLNRYDNSIQSIIIATPKIVLPESNFNFFRSPSLTRQSATNLRLYYDYPASEHKGINKLGLGALPVPDKIIIHRPYPIALPEDLNINPSLKLYPYSDIVSISGERLKLLGGTSENTSGMHQAMLPARFDTGLDDELMDFRFFRDHSEKQIRKRPDIIPYHQDYLDHFVNYIGLISLAVNDRSLNPR